MLSFIKQYKNHLLLHFIVLIWGFTGILGKVITLDSSSLVWYRMLIALFGILAFIIARQNFKTLKKSFRFKFIFVGFVVAAHWICFFEAIKVSNVSVTLATLSSTTLFVAILEPLFYKRKVIFYEVLLGALVIVGLGMIFNFEPQYRLGIGLAIAAAFFAAVFSTVNGLFVREASPSVISFYEMLGGVIGISLYLLIKQPEFGLPFPSNQDTIYLLILGLICTAFAFVISVEVLKTLSPFTSSISINMEPVYAIVLALLFFGDDEKMTFGFYSGALLIFLTILSNAWLKTRFKSVK